jgi:hypothetical protein
MDNPICYICKKEILSSEASSFLSCPDGNSYLVHNRHRGVIEEGLRQLKQHKLTNREKEQ